MISKPFARITVLLYLIPPTPAVLVSPYTEPFFAVCTFAGLLLAVKKRYLLASLPLACATSLRATGIFAAPLLAGIALHLSKRWTVQVCLFIQITQLVYLFSDRGPDSYQGIGTLPDYRYPFSRIPVLRLHRFLPSSGNSTVVSIADTLFIQLRPSGILVRSSHLPSTIVVDTKLILRNIGFLKYWTLAQIPNLVIAAPVLFISLIGLYRLASRQSSLPRGVIPFALHHAGMTFLMITSSHTQIALRVISTDPTFWWLLGDLAVERGLGRSTLTRIGRIWIWWSVLWGAVSIVLWAGHYPPA